MEVGAAVNLRKYVASLVLIATVAADLRSEEAGTKPAIERLLFGSCIQQDRPTPIFRTMLRHEPDVVVFLGDNIYADTEDMQVMRAKYDRLSANPDFQALRDSCSLLATWDDHDYGVNDGGREYAARHVSQKVFLDFWRVPAGSPRRKRAGVYDARIYGPPGQRLQIILLDTRFFRSALKTGERRLGGPYVPDADPAKTMLGEEQWEWLAKQLRRPAEVRIIASGIQFAASAAGQETWSNLPHERQRLLDLIASTEAAGVLFLSGDRHWAELSVIESDVSYPLYDLTSSSFNQVHPRGTPTENAFRASGTTFHRENYGVVHIDWSAADPEIRLEIRDLDGMLRIEKRLRLSQLQP